MNPQPARLGCGPIVVLVIAMSMISLLAMWSLTTHVVLPIYFLAAVIIAAVVASTVTATGTALAAWLVGLTIVRVAIGPIRYDRRIAGRRYSINHSWRLVVVPARAVPTGSELSRRKLVLHAAGGLLGALMLGSAGIILFAIWLPWFTWPYTLNEPLSMATGGIYVLVTACVSTAIAYVLSWPLLAVTSDLHQLLRPGRGASRLLAIREAEGLLADGVRPRDWTPELVERLAQPPGWRPPLGLAEFTMDFDVRAQWLASLHALDRQDVDTARLLLRRAQAAVPRFWGADARADLFVTLAWFAATHDRDSVTARAWLAKVNRSSAEPHAVALAEAAILCVDQQYDNAIVVANEGALLLGNSIWAGLVVMDADRLTFIIQECVRGLGSSADVQLRSPDSNPSQAVERLLESCSGQRRGPRHRIRARRNLGIAFIVVPVVAIVAIVGWINSDLPFPHRPDQLGRGTSASSIEALLSASDLGEGWVSLQVDSMNGWHRGSAVPCTTKAMFGANQVTEYSRGKLRWVADPTLGPWLDEMVTYSDEQSARESMTRLEAALTCDTWERRSGDYVLQPLRINSIGDQVVAYQLTWPEGDKQYVSNEVVVREGGVVVHVSHIVLNESPVVTASEELARRALDKASASLQPAQ